MEYFQITGHCEGAHGQGGTTPGWAARLRRGEVCTVMRSYYESLARLIKRPAARREGSALLELALVMPILCLLLLGVFDLGRVFAEQVAVVAAAREGARAATYLSDNNAVKAIVVAEINNTVVITPATDIDVVRNTGLQTISVTVRYRHPLLFGLFEGWGGGGQLTASGTATMPMVLVFGGTPPPVNTPPPTGTPVPTNTPTATNTPTVTRTPTITPTVTRTPTVTPTPCPLNVSVVYAQQMTNGSNKIYLQVRVVNACTGQGVTGATVKAPAYPTLSFVAAATAGNYNSCGTGLGGLITSITVNATLGSQSGSGSGPVGNTNPTCQP